MHSQEQISSVADNPELQNQLLSLQNRILEGMVKGVAELQQLLDSLCLCAEELAPNAIASIMLLDDDNHLHVKAAPSASPKLIEDLSGLTPSSDGGSCSNAVFTGEPTYISNTLNDDKWSAMRSIAKRYHTDSCWSHPVHDGEKVTGTFALSNSEPAAPTEFQRTLLAICANLVSLILKQQKQREALWAAAHHDALTGLPNRLLLERHLQHAIKNARRSGKGLAILFLDMDNFKEVNDTYGHDFGDHVLTLTTRKIRKTLREGDIVARHGGDEFILLLENFSNKLDINGIARKILTSFHEPLVIKDHKIQIGFSIGISIYPDDANDANNLLQNADIAMYQAKRAGKGSIQYFERQMADQIHNKVEMEQRLNDALDNKELVLFYQPQFEKDSNVIESIEALLRWNHPQKGLLLPAEFLPAAEQSKLISKISLHVFQMACRQIISWMEHGLNVPRVSINFPGSMLKENFVQELNDLLKQTGCPAEKLEIEITEVLVMNQGVKGIAELNKLGSLGVLMSLDDFGTGFSSISQLESLPVKKIKIDESFITNLDHNANDRRIVETIIGMGKSLNMRIVAEGVETAEQQQYLLEKGCDIIQGYYRQRPVTGDEMEKLLKPA